MGNTLITFEDKYCYEYDGDRDVNDKGLTTIGGYESAWLADLVAAFVLENTQCMFKMTTFDYSTYFPAYVHFGGDLQNDARSLLVPVPGTCAAKHQ
jgi:hypothetical protein